jgi:hypothetical protein
MGPKEKIVMLQFQSRVSALLRFVSMGEILFWCWQTSYDCRGALTKLGQLINTFLLNQ